MKKFLRILLVIFIVIVSIVILAAILLITPRKHILFTPESIAQDNELSGQLLDTVADALVTEDGDVVDEADINIPPEQFNALLRAAVYTSDLKRAEDDYIIEVVSDNGCIKTSFYFDLPIGGNVPLVASLIPMMRDGKLAVDVKKLKIGHISTSESAIEGVIADELKKFNASDNGKLFSAAVKNITIDTNGTLGVKLNPEMFSKFVLTVTGDKD